MTFRARLLLISGLVPAFATVLFLSLDITAHREYIYTAELSLKPASGILKLVFYGDRYAAYRSDSSIKFAADEWDVARNSDSTVLTARTDRAAITVTTNGPPLYVGLLRFPGGGTAILSDALANRQEFDLRADSESIYPLTVGGATSAVPAVPAGQVMASFHYYGNYALIIAMLSLLAAYQMRPARDVPRPPERPAPLAELAGYAAPLMLTPLLVQLAYWPASVPYDGSLQWLEATVPGHLSPAIVIPTTLLFRLFSKVSGSPAPVVFAQMVLAALGVSLILREIRKRGVARRTTQFAALLIALLPQYPTFVSTLSKDAWNLVGLLLLTYAALALLRHDHERGRLPTLILVITMGLAAVFAGVMRPNTFPAILLFMLVMAIHFRRRSGAGITASLFVIYVAAALAAPTAIIYFSAERQAERAAGQATGGNDVWPLGEFANVYIIHLFAAAVHDEVPISAEAAEIFYGIAPKTAWQEYDCAYVDKTQVALSNSDSERLHNPAEGYYWPTHQVEMALIVAKLLAGNPGVLWRRQACVSKILWYIGYHTTMFQTTATLGYDDMTVLHPFIAAVGENHSLIGNVSRQWLGDYLSWSEAPTRMWLFWRPFLYTCLGLFAVLLYSLARQRRDALLVATLPLMLTLSLAVVIPFPAFRYQYPATLLLILLSLLTFARPVKRAGDTGTAAAIPGTVDGTPGAGGISAQARPEPSRSSKISS